MDSIQRLKMLISLATVDGELDERERQHIISIGLANHLMVAEILPLFKTAADPIPAAAEDREGLLIELVQLMRIDEKIYKEEMRYCAQVASRLGFQEVVVFELMLQARNLTSSDKDALRSKLKSFLKSAP